MYASSRRTSFSIFAFRAWAGKSTSTDCVASCPGSSRSLLYAVNFTTGSLRASSSLMGRPWASMYRILPATSRTDWFPDVFFRRSVPVSFAGETTRPEPCSTRSVTFISVISPIRMPAVTFTDAGVTAYVLSSIVTAVADGPCAQPRVITATVATMVAPIHFDIVVSLPRRRCSASGRRPFAACATRHASALANGLRLALYVGEERRMVVALQPLLDQGAKDDLEAHRELERGGRPSRQDPSPVQRILRKDEKDTRSVVDHRDLPRLGLCITYICYICYSPMKKRSQPGSRGSTQQRGRAMTAGTFVTVFVVGLIAAWLAASYVKDGGYGLIWDMVLALVGSALAYGIVRAAGMAPDGGVFATMVVAFVGAASLIGAQRRFWQGAPVENVLLPRRGPSVLGYRKH